MSRRINPKPEFAMQQRVEQLWGAFEYPDIDPNPLPFELAGGAGGDPSILIAASDATPQSKEMAHYIATGVNDDVLINVALGIFLDNGPAQGGRLVLSEGNFFLRPDEVVVTDNMHLHGLGAYKTTLRNVGAGTSSSNLIEVQTDAEVSDLGVNTDTFSGRVFFNDFGRVRNIAHTGDALTGVFVDGAEQPMSDWALNGDYSDAAVVVDFGSLTLSNVTSARVSGSGGGAFMRITGNSNRPTVISNLSVIHGSDIGNGIEIEDTGNLVLNGFSIRTPGDVCLGTNGNAGPFRILASNGYLEGDYGVQIQAIDGFFYSVMSDLTIVPDLIGLDIASATDSRFSDMVIYQPGEHGVVLDGTECDLQGITVYRPGRDTDNTFDGFNLDGDRNTLTGCRVVPAPSGNATRYGINIIGGNNNAVYANYLGDSSDYGTADSVDSGTGTQTSPTAGVIGGQFAF